ncbi:MAG: hypothetical protein RLZZ175_408 [Bacteroidota bacterium]
MVKFPSQMQQFTCNHIDNLPQTAQEICDYIGDKTTIWLFNGQMGAGKTTLIAQICKHLGVVDNVQSPTFSIVNEYFSKTKGTLYHFDFYRIKNELEAIELGAEEYFESGNLCFIEWSELIPRLLPTTFAEINIIAINENERVIEVKLVG